MTRLLSASALLWMSGGMGLVSAADEPREGVRWGLMPIGNFTTDRGFTVGGIVRRFDYGEKGGEKEINPFHDLMTLQGAYSTLGARQLLAAYEKTGVSAMNLRVSLDAVASQSDNERYYGLGESSDFQREAARQGFYFYRQEVYGIGASARREWSEDFDLEAALAYAFTFSRPSETDSRYERDFGRGTLRSTYPRFSLRTILEKRDSEFIPSRGYYGMIGVTLSPGALGNEESWARMDLDSRKYLPILPSRWLNAILQFRYTAATAEAPLIEKARLGSLGTLRGLPQNRYLSNQSASLRGELRSIWLRWRVFGLPLKLGTGIFTDAGWVAPTLGELLSSRTHVGYGVSWIASYFTDDFIGSMDIGFSEGQSALYMRLGLAL